MSSETSQKKEATGRALCFSGGVDSFYSLLTYSKPIDKLIMVIGFDVDICDREGFLSVHEHLKKVAAAKDVEAVIVRTNYREHPVAGKKFKYAYGGALAGVGHLVSGVGEILLSSGFRYDEARPDGSHWQNDPLWGSESLSVVHYGADLTRAQKLRKIAADPIVRKHLRVCQENLKKNFQLSAHAINCGCCQKCIRTLLVLGQEGGTLSLDIFKNRTDLALSLYKVPDAGDHLIAAYEEIIKRGVTGEMTLSIRALLRRSRILKKYAWLGRKGRKLILAVLWHIDRFERHLHFC